MNKLAALKTNAPKLFGNLLKDAGKYITLNRRAFFAVGLQLLAIIAINSLPAIAQMPNPWGGSGTSKLANAGSNLLVIGTWIAFFVGIISFILIPLFIKMEWNYTKLIFSGITGIGGFAILGAIAYDIVNLNSITMPDPTLGR